MNHLRKRLTPAFIYAVLTATITTLSCSVTAGVPTDTFDTTVLLNKKEQAVVDGNNAFALDLYREISSKEGNIFYSPFSISTVLAMAYAGAREDTEEQMQQTLHFKAPQNKIHSIFSKLQKTVEAAQTEGNIELAVANSLWPHVKYPFLDSYLELLKEHYNSEVTPLDYTGQTEKSRQTINQWTEDRTRNRIKELIPQGGVNYATKLVLVNAIYFKGNWATPFRKKATTMMPFFPTQSRSVNTPLMHQTNNYNYFADNQVQVLELPYAGNDLSMVVILPKQQDGLSRIESELSTTKLNSWLSNMGSTKVSIWLPKLKSTIKYSLKYNLINLGMTNAFCGGNSADCSRADFSGMDGSKDLLISDVLHKAFVEVNEEGTEAAAATATVMMLSGFTQPPPVQEFRADHPFIFLIRDRTTQSILFVGRVVNP